jgi:hypothetical protein
MAWEWLRRDPGYCAAAACALPREGGGPPNIIQSQPDAGQWGLHAFEDPRLAAPAARPVWRSDWHGRVLAARAEPAGAAHDRFDFSRFADLATMVKAPAGGEHILLAQAGSNLRLDIQAGTTLDGPVRLAYLLAGIEAAVGPVQTLLALLGLLRRGQLDTPPARSRNRRLILLLRTHDAIRSGATQREIASLLLTREPLPPRWRIEMPSLRSQAQRLVHGAAAMAGGGYRALLRQ